MGRRDFSGISSRLLSARGFTDLLYMVLPVGLQSLMVMGDYVYTTCMYMQRNLNRVIQCA